MAWCRPRRPVSRLIIEMAHDGYLGNELVVRICTNCR